VFGVLAWVNYSLVWGNNRVVDFSLSKFMKGTEEHLVRENPGFTPAGGMVYFRASLHLPKPLS
jgi:hypothetical protein